MGNITRLVRRIAGDMGYYYAGKFDFTYTGNRAATVKYNNGTYRTFVYVNNGNTTKDGFIDWTYNYLNLPETAVMPANFTRPTTTLTYQYTAGGEKLSRTKVTTSPASTYTDNYISGIEYRNNTLDMMHTEEGRYLFSSNVYQYNLTDHLGNVRVMIQQSGTGSATVEQENEYYAFGLSVNRKVVSPENKYLYNGKEWQPELGAGQYDYGARFYNPVIGRWNVVDPKAELYDNYSPYVYVANNPIMLIDPNGMEIISVEDGVKFTREDAVSAYRILSGRARNVYVDIEGKFGRRQAIKAQDKKASYGPWAVFSVENLSKANLALSAFEDKSIENLALETHGTVNSKGVSFIATNDVKGDKEYINSNEIAYVNSGATNAVNNSIIQSKVADLKSIAAKVTDGGRFIIASCFVGQGDAGKAFGSSLSVLTGNRFNTYLATGFLTPGEYTSSTGPGIYINNSFKVDQRMGWLQITPNGSSQNLRTLKLSTNSTSPVNITK